MTAYAPASGEGHHFCTAIAVRLDKVRRGGIHDGVDGLALGTLCIGNK
jgi:hypothetical protein